MGITITMLSFYNNNNEKKVTEDNKTISPVAHTGIWLSLSQADRAGSAESRSRWWRKNWIQFNPAPERNTNDELEGIQEQRVNETTMTMWEMY